MQDSFTDAERREIVEAITIHGERRRARELSMQDTPEGAAGDLRQKIISDAEEQWRQDCRDRWRASWSRPPATPGPGAMGRARDQQEGLLQATGEGKGRQEMSEGDMCFLLANPDFLSEMQLRPSRQPASPDWLSESPWAFLDKAETPAERQRLIYAHQHKTRDAHFRDQDRAEELAEGRNYWKAAARRNLEAGFAAVDRAFVQGCVAGSVVGVVAIVALWLLAPILS